MSTPHYSLRHHHLKKEARNAIILAAMCFVSYLAVYFLRNILSTVSPQMISSGEFTEDHIGLLSGIFFASYAVGQLINGILGDIIKAKYMLSIGLTMAGVCNIAFIWFKSSLTLTTIAYGLVGLFLSMIYAHMTKVVSENVNLNYAQRCSIGYTFSSFLGSPAAGMCAAYMSWHVLFYMGGGLLIAIGIAVYIFFLIVEKKKIVTYGNFKAEKKSSGGSIKVLLQRQIVKFTVISVITGIVRTSVVFWLPTYLFQYLNFSEEQSALLFTLSTLFISLSAFLTMGIFELLKKDMDKTIFLSFVVSALAFLGAFFVKQQIVNIIFMILAIMMSNCATSMLWSYYC
ncbi:MAG: MFS transporter, partial [Clostridia bacterium]|nr:MFS transporter [Clostridia bacterium]